MKFFALLSLFFLSACSNSQVGNGKLAICDGINGVLTMPKYSLETYGETLFVTDGTGYVPASRCVFIDLAKVKTEEEPEPTGQRAYRQGE